MKVLFLIPYPQNSAPSQRFRFEQYLRFLEENKVQIDVQSFLDKKSWEVLYLKGYSLLKFWGIAKGFTRRSLKVLFGLNTYDYIFIHREVSPIGPPIFEWWIAKVARKKIIYDFDDAIWLPNTSEQNDVISNLKWHRKVGAICKWSWKVSVGNDYLAEFARRYNGSVEVIPTTIDLGYHQSDGPAPRQSQDTLRPTIIGWTGTHSTAAFLSEMKDIIKVLALKDSFQFLIISNEKPDLDLPNIKFLKWAKESEIEDLQKIDIGIMPMPDNEWTQGKCGFKALQFMALGKPVVAAPVGVNNEIIQDGENGFLASTNEEWVAKLSQLIENPDLREKLGKAGRQTVIERYSVEANKEKYLKLFLE